MTTGRDETWRTRASAAIESGPLSHLRGYLTPRMWKMLLIVVVALVLIFAWIILSPIVKYLTAPKGTFGPQAQTVSTVPARKTMWQTQLTSVGTLHAVEGSDLASELAGIVAAIDFKPGDDVEKGTLLVQLRDDSDRAQLAALQAGAELARLTYERNAALLKTNAISKQAYDTALANMKNMRAQADAQAATVAKKAIRAPFAGRVGIRLVDVGQFVGAGQSVVTLQMLDPIYVYFSVPQQQIALLKVGDKVRLTTDAVAGETFQGVIDAWDSKADSATRNVRVQALIRNPGKKLLPGMFGTVVTNVGALRPTITLPQTAVTYNPYGDTVFVVVKSKAEDGSEQLTAEQRFVTLGDTRGDQVAVLKGLTPRDEVVSSGQLKLKNGTAVTVNNSVRLPNDSAPTPVQQ
jgi:membrane fusion protein, multidrug efflux system